MDHIVAALSEIAEQYPSREFVDFARRDSIRQAWQIAMVTARIRENGSVCDIGGGTGSFSVGLATLGYRVTLVDDFADGNNVRQGLQVLDLHRARGVTVVAANAVEDEFDLGFEKFDAITTFDSMEHWHNSPKGLFRRVVQALRPGGMFFIGTPNCVNLRKRITVPLGRGKWTPIEQWYEEARMRGHVREPDVDDLRYIANDMGLARIEVFGRNWTGYLHPSPLIRRLTPALDRALQIFPTLCSDIYLLGFK